MLDARPNHYARNFLRLIRPQKALVWLILWSFLFNTIGGVIFLEEARAARTPLELTSVGSNRNVGPGAPSGIEPKELNVGTFVLPQELGMVRDAWAPDTSTLRRGQPSDKGLAQGEYELRPSVVIHIQDAHCNYGAQQKISEIIGYLNKEYGVSQLNLEGGAKGYDLSTFTDITDDQIREKVSDYFVKEGALNGAEYYAVNNPEKVSLWGVEDKDLYLDNLKVYRDSLGYKDFVENKLKSLNHILSNLKTKIYSRDLFDFDKNYTAYKAGNMPFKDYLSFLSKEAATRGIDIKAYPNIFMLNQTLDEEGKIDFRRANNQRDELIDAIQKKSSKKMLEELVQKTIALKTEQLSQKDFYTYLLNRANDASIEMGEYPELQKYIVYLSLYDAIDKTKIMEETDAVEDAVKESLYKNDEERELSGLSKNLSILKNIFGISLTKDDYAYYLKNEASFDMRNYVSFIDKEAPLYKISARPDRDIERVDGYREEISRFYEYSFRRDEAFVRNMKSGVLRSQRSEVRGQNRVAILVTGGFHTENLCELFREQGIAYVSIMPTFKNPEGYKSPYFSILGGKPCALIESLMPQSAAMQVASYLNTEMSEDVYKIYGVKAFQIAKVIVEMLERKGAGSSLVITDLNERIMQFTLAEDGTVTETPLTEEPTGVEAVSMRNLINRVEISVIDMLDLLPADNFKNLSEGEFKNNVLDPVLNILRGLDVDISDIEEMATTKKAANGKRSFITGVTGNNAINYNGVDGIFIDVSDARTIEEMQRALLHELAAAYGILHDNNIKKTETLASLPSGKVTAIASKIRENKPVFSKERAATASEDKRDILMASSQAIGSDGESIVGMASITPAGFMDTVHQEMSSQHQGLTEAGKESANAFLKTINSELLGINSPEARLNWVKRIYRLRYGRVHANRANFEDVVVAAALNEYMKVLNKQIGTREGKLGTQLAEIEKYAKRWETTGRAASATPSRKPATSEEIAACVDNALGNRRGGYRKYFEKEYFCSPSLINLVNIWKNASGKKIAGKEVLGKMVQGIKLHIDFMDEDPAVQEEMIPAILAMLDNMKLSYKVADFRAEGLRLNGTQRGKTISVLFAHPDGRLYIDADILKTIDLIDNFIADNGWSKKESVFSENGIDGDRRIGKSNRLGFRFGSYNGSVVMILPKENAALRGLERMKVDNRGRYDNEFLSEKAFTMSDVEAIRALARPNLSKDFSYTRRDNVEWSEEVKKALDKDISSPLKNEVRDALPSGEVQSFAEMLKGMGKKLRQNNLGIKSCGLLSSAGGARSAGGLFHASTVNGGDFVLKFSEYLKHENVAMLSWFNEWMATERLKEMLGEDVAGKRFKTNDPVGFLRATGKNSEADAFEEAFNNKNWTILVDLVRANFVEDDCLYLAIPMLDLNRYKPMNQAFDGEMDYERKKAWIFNLVKYVRQLHQAGMTHRDLKPENIFVDTSTEDDIAIVDFETVAQWEEEDGKIKFTDFPSVATPRFAHPLQFNKDMYNTATPQEVKEFILHQDLYALAGIIESALFEHDIYSSGSIEHLAILLKKKILHKVVSTSASMRETTFDRSKMLEYNRNIAIKRMESEINRYESPVMSTALSAHLEPIDFAALKVKFAALKEPGKLLVERLAELFTTSVRIGAILDRAVANQNAEVDTVELARSMEDFKKAGEDYMKALVDYEKKLDIAMKSLEFARDTMDIQLYDKLSASVVLPAAADTAADLIYSSDLGENLRDALGRLPRYYDAGQPGAVEAITGTYEVWNFLSRYDKYTGREEATLEAFAQSENVSVFGPDGEAFCRYVAYLRDELGLSEDDVSRIVNAARRFNSAISSGRAVKEETMKRIMELVAAGVEAVPAPAGDATAIAAMQDLEDLMLVDLQPLDIPEIATMERTIFDSNPAFVKVTRDIIKEEEGTDNDLKRVKIMRWIYEYVNASDPQDFNDIKGIIDRSIGRTGLNRSNFEAAKIEYEERADVLASAPAPAVSTPPFGMGGTMLKPEVLDGILNREGPLELKDAEIESIFWALTPGFYNDTVAGYREKVLAILGRLSDAQKRRLEDEARLNWAHPRDNMPGLLVKALGEAAPAAAAVPTAQSPEFIEDLIGKTEAAEEDVIVLSEMAQGVKVTIDLTNTRPTTEMGVLANETVFGMVSVSVGGRRYNFNVPIDELKGMNRKDILEKTRSWMEFLRAEEAQFAALGGNVPENIVLNIYFAKTGIGFPLSKQSYGRYGDLFTHTHATFSETMNDRSGEVMRHEFAHVLTGVSIKAQKNDARVRAIEEGLANYMAGQSIINGREMGGGDVRTKITGEQAARIAGMSQLDVDASIFGKDVATAPSPSGVRGYLGMTHHSFGLQFIHAFVETFGNAELMPFIESLYTDMPSVPVDEDLGSGMTRKILTGLGYSADEIAKFETRLHERLLANVFKTESAVVERVALAPAAVPTAQSPEFIEDLTRKTAAAGMEVPVVPGLTAVTPAVSAEDGFNKLMAAQPKYNTGVVNKFFNEATDKAEALYAIEYAVSVREGIEAVLNLTNPPQEQQYSFLPNSEALCAVNSGTLQGAMQAVWKGERQRLNGVYGFGNINLIFYDGKPANLKYRMDGLVSQGVKITDKNAVVFIDGETTKGMDVAAFFSTNNINANRIVDTLQIDGQTKEPMPGYLSVGAHIAVSSGILDLVRSEKPNPELAKAILNLIGRMSNDPNMYNDVSAEDADNALRTALRNGTLQIMLPPASAIEINENMKNFILSEEAARKSL